MLPVEPILPFLRNAVADGHEVGPTHRRGIRELARRLSAMSGKRFDAEERRLHRILAGQVRRLDVYEADRLAYAIGRHPVGIWVGDFHCVRGDDDGRGRACQSIVA